MANSPSARKRIRQNATNAEINQVRVTQLRNAIKKVEAAIAGGDKTAASAALRAAEPLVMRGAQKNMLHRKTAARKISRLSARIKVL